MDQPIERTPLVLKYGGRTGTSYLLNLATHKGDGPSAPSQSASSNQPRDKKLAVLRVGNGDRRFQPIVSIQIQKYKCCEFSSGLTIIFFPCLLSSARPIVRSLKQPPPLMKLGSPTRWRYARLKRAIRGRNKHQLNC